jgi:hypothetical protein
VLDVRWGCWLLQHSIHHTAHQTTNHNRCLSAQLAGASARLTSWQPARPSPAQPSPAQPSPAQPSPAQPSPAQPSPRGGAPAPPLLPKATLGRRGKGGGGGSDPPPLPRRPDPPPRDRTPRTSRDQSAGLMLSKNIKYMGTRTRQSIPFPLQACSFQPEHLPLSHLSCYLRLVPSLRSTRACAVPLFPAAKIAGCEGRTRAPGHPRPQKIFGWIQIRASGLWCGPSARAVERKGRSRPWSGHLERSPRGHRVAPRHGARRSGNGPAGPLSRRLSSPRQHDSRLEGP